MRAYEQSSAVDSDKAILELTKELLGLKLTRNSFVANSGLSVSCVRSLQAHFELTDSETQMLLPAIPNWKKQASRCLLSSVQGHRVVQIASVLARAQWLFDGSPNTAIAWMRGKKKALRNRTPLQLLANATGAAAVEEQLFAIEHGIFG